MTNTTTKTNSLAAQIRALKAPTNDECGRPLHIQHDRGWESAIEAAATLAEKAVPEQADIQTEYAEYFANIDRAQELLRKIASLKIGHPAVPAPQREAGAAGSVDSPAFRKFVQVHAPSLQLGGEETFKALIGLIDAHTQEEVAKAREEAAASAIQQAIIEICSTFDLKPEEGSPLSFYWALVDIKRKYETALSAKSESVGVDLSEARAAMERAKKLPVWDDIDHRLHVELDVIFKALASKQDSATEHAGEKQAAVPVGVTMRAFQAAHDKKWHITITHPFGTSSVRISDQRDIKLAELLAAAPAPTTQAGPQPTYAEWRKIVTLVQQIISTVRSGPAIGLALQCIDALEAWSDQVGQAPAQRGEQRVIADVMRPYIAPEDFGVPPEYADMAKNYANWFAASIEPNEAKPE